MTANFGLLVASGCLIIFSCFAASLTIMNWRQKKTRRLMLPLTLLLMLSTIISIYFLFQIH